MKWVFSKNEAIKRDKAFLSSYVEKRAIPWQFSHSNVKYTMTCAMDTVLMTIYLLWFRRHLPPKIPYMDETTRDIIRCIDNGDHARARYVFVMTKMKTPNNFTKAKPEDNPFNCTSTIHDITGCSFLFQYHGTVIKNECSKCKRPKCETPLYRVGIVCDVNSDISNPQEKILDAQGFNGEVSYWCRRSQAIDCSTERKENVSEESNPCCRNKCYQESKLQRHPAILSIHTKIATDTAPMEPTGVSSLSSLQKEIQIHDVVYHLGAVIFGNGDHFCSITLDPNLGGDLNVFYDGIPRGGKGRTNLVPFRGSYKEIVGEYDINQLWYIKQKRTNATKPSLDLKEPLDRIPDARSGEAVTGSSLDSKPFPSAVAHGVKFAPDRNNDVSSVGIDIGGPGWEWNSVNTSDVWKDGDDMDFTYHGAFNENSILCELTPFVLGHLNSKNTLWNETVMRSFIVALAHHMDMYNGSDIRSYFLTPTILTVNQEYIESMKKKQTKTMRVTLAGFNEALLERWKSHNSFVFLMHFDTTNEDGDHLGHYIVVIVDKGDDHWGTTVTGYDVYDELHDDIWKECVHFIAKQLGVTNRTNVVFQTKASRKIIQPSPYKWFAKIENFPDDKEYDDDRSCGPYCLNFLLDLYQKHKRLKPGLIPEVTSELLRRRTKTRMIPVLIKLMKPLAEVWTSSDKSFLEVHSVVGEMEGGIGTETYQKGPEKYSMKHLNLSLLSLSANDLCNIILANGCPCSRPMYSGAPYVQCGSCYAVFHIECFFGYVKHLDGDKMNCYNCSKEVGCNADMLLVPARRQLPHSSNDYKNDGVLVLDFMKCGSWSKEVRGKIRETWVNFFASHYGKSWSFVSPYEEAERAEQANSKVTGYSSTPKKTMTANATLTEKNGSADLNGSNSLVYTDKVTESNEGSKEESISCPSKSNSVKCSWSISSKGCVFHGLEPKDVCGIEGCNNVFHHACQTEWELFQYRLEHPNGNPNECPYDSAGKKRCIYHHPHRDLALGDKMTDSRQPTVNVPQVRSNALSTEDDTISMTPNQQFFIDRIGVNPGKSLEKYIKDISEMYPETNVARFGEIMKLPDGWQWARANAAESAYAKVKNMISGGKLKYCEDSAEDSDDSVASYMQPRKTKENIDDYEKKFFTSLPSCYSMFFAFDTGNIVESACPFSKFNQCWRKKNELQDILKGIECKNHPCKMDGLRAHIASSHGKSWWGMGALTFLEELYPQPPTGNNRPPKRKSKF